MRDPPPSSGDPDEDAAARDVIEDAAAEYQERWGCPAAGHTPPATLDGDLVAEARHVARVTSTPEAETCPFACVERASLWVAELTAAVALRELVPDLTETIGRPLSAADLQALQSLHVAQNEALASDRRIAEEERAARRARGLA